MSHLPIERCIRQPRIAFIRSSTMSVFIYRIAVTIMNEILLKCHMLYKHGCSLMNNILFECRRKELDMFIEE